MSEASDYKALLSFAIGPVQPFIAAARRTQDLFVGSKILSYLADTALSAAGGSPIYPLAQNQSGESNTPNKLLIGFTSDHKAAADAARTAQEAVEKKWSELALLVRDYLISLAPDLDTSIWQKQVDTALEIYWVTLDLASPPALEGYDLRGKYGTRVAAAESLLASRKLLRDFSQYGPEQRGPMSSIGGVRPALRGVTPAKEAGSARLVREFWQNLAEQLARPAVLALDGGEQLDAISAVKRFLNGAMVWATDKKNEHQISNEHRELAERLKATFWGDKARQPIYPSTSDMAAADLRAGIIRTLTNADPKPDVVKKRNNLTAKLQAYHAALLSAPADHPLAQREGDIPGLVTLANAVKLDAQPREALLHYDGDLLFYQNISAKMLANDYQQPATEETIDRRKVRVPTKDTERLARDLRETASSLISAARDADIYCTSPYYAVVIMDGDRMGALLREMDSSLMHTALTNALEGFADKGASGIVGSEQHLGRLIYAGGDDVMAVFPLITALPATIALLKAYRAAMLGKTELAGVFKVNSHLGTASAGIAIAHHLTPLDFVLAQAHAAEEDAKERYKRNAIAIRILRRSGQHTTAGYQFGFDGNQVQHDQLAPIIELADYIAAGSVSPRLSYDFAREAHALNSNAMAASELRRLLQRHSSVVKDDERLPQEERGKLFTEVRRDDLAAGLASLHQQIGGPQASRELAEWLGVAEFIARGGQED